MLAESRGDERLHPNRSTDLQNSGRELEKRLRNAEKWVTVNTDCYPGAPLTASERRLAEALLGGLSDHEIAAALHLSSGTVKTQMHRLNVKLYLASRKSRIDKRVKLAIALHKLRRELGITCPCDR